jgi:ribosomal-protein-alanine N-acetyltransferase
VTVSATTMAVHKQPRPVALRDMRRDDLAAVLEIERRSFAQPWSRGFFEKELATPFARLVVAVDETAPRPTIVGYTCRWRVTDEVHLLNVAIHPEHRGLGHGRDLVEAVIAEARAARARVVFLEVRAGNVVARRLYRLLGFRDLGVRRGYYGPGQDAIVMELRLEGGGRGL